MKIAIIQDTITFGGRFSVILEIIKLLNNKGFTPDLICGSISFSKEDIKITYQQDISVNILIKKHLHYDKLNETAKLLFPLQIRRFLKNYDIIINSNNTLHFLPVKTFNISYIHFPRLARVSKGNIHVWPGQKEKIKFKTKLAKAIDSIIVKATHKLFRISDQIIIANSKFSKNAIMKYYKIPDNLISVIYPPVDYKHLLNHQPKKNKIISLGRFSENKNQLEQIRIAKNIEGYEFVLAGFNSDPNYLKECKLYIEINHIKNVILKPDLEYNQVINELQESRYFIHTTWNEPFGITTVQGIAAGCIPIVPDSGGQIEIVPFRELRFKTFDDIPLIIKKEYHKNNKYIKELTKNIINYSPEIFNERFSHIINLKLN